MVTEEHRRIASDIVDMLQRATGDTLKCPQIIAAAIAKELDEAERRGANTGA